MVGSRREAECRPAYLLLPSAYCHMKLSDLTNHAGEWLRGDGPMSEIVISSRIRLARNLAGLPFLARALYLPHAHSARPRIAERISGSVASPAGRS